ncbi:motility associated factor glycosyltransferase family protein [Paenibacillus hunanensis]|uniref:6-hydroxymethylpterin diphosphokinase MptE-like domain-containing protein n=1 Tax=Paenibacillus hunanensis TaxID=539262 RepID=A0ABU1ITM2_9BACL|nr:6-hydroxymethylpterin diphosphokinase MptE-like protein [Paenibacillus hunanensis]MDR6242609.1 hypothetical protein [Paenibacillus hunanensis]
MLELNLRALQERFPHVSNKLLVRDKEVDAPQFYTEAWEKDIAWLEAVKGSVEELNIIFVYGFGQGLGIADLLEMYPDRWLFIYEEDEQSFLNSMEKYDFRELINHPNIQWVSVGENQLNMLFYLVCSYMQQEMAFVALRHYLDHHYDVLKEVQDKFKEYNLVFQSNKSTQEHFQQRWIENSLYQIDGMLSTPPIERFIDRLPDSTAIVTGSGPSLQKDIEWLKKIKPHALIIAAGSSVQALVKNGITPHMVVLMDGGEINNKVFQNPETLQPPLLFTSSAYYEISNQKQDNKLFAIMRNDQISQYYMGLEQEQLVISSTPTVTGTAMQVAIRLGARRIIMMGQDLSFPNDQFYAEGVLHSDADIIESSIRNAPYEVLNVHGGHNRTNSSFLFMKNALEELVAAFSEVEFINSTRDGAAIEGANWKPIEEVYDMLKTNNVEPNVIEDMIKTENNVYDGQKAQMVKQKIVMNKNDLIILKNEIKEIQKMINKIQELSRTKPTKAQKSLETIEQSWGEIVNRDWFETVYDTILPQKMVQFDQQLPQIVTERNLIQKSNLIYQHLGHLLNEINLKIPYLDELFEKAIQRIDNLIIQRNDKSADRIL